MTRSVPVSGGPPDSPSPELEAARRAAETVKLCPDCEAPEHQGLCHSEKCRASVRPGVQGPKWAKGCAPRRERDEESWLLLVFSRYVVLGLVPVVSIILIISFGGL